MWHVPVLKPCRQAQKPFGHTQEAPHALHMAAGMHNPGRGAPLSFARSGRQGRLVVAGHPLRHALLVPLPYALQPAAQPRLTQ